MALLFALVGLFARPMVDDYSLHNLFAKKSIFESISYMYLNWSGRSFTLFLCDLALMDFRFTSIFVVGVALAYVFSIRSLVSMIGSSTSNSFIFSAFALAILTLCLSPFIPHVVFWPSSGLTYITPLLVSLAWIKVFYYELEELEYKNILFSIFAGSLLEQASILMIFLAVLSFLEIGPNNQKGTLKNKGLFLCALLVGVLFLVLAPGNFVRSEVMSKMNPENMEFFERVIEVFRRLVLASWKKVILAFIGGVFFSALSKELFNRGSWSLKNFSIIWIGASIALIIPFVIVDTPLNNRTLFYPLLCLSFFGFGAGLFTGGYFKRMAQNIIKSEKVRKVIYLLPIFFFGAFLIKEAILAYKLSAMIDKRFEAISSSSNKVIKVQRISPQGSKLMFFKEISKDSNHWVNASMAEYFKVESISLK